MLLEFKIANYRSIGEEQTLSLVPANNQKEYEVNIFHDGKYEALNALAIYGPNAGGKSNIIRGLGCMSFIITHSAKLSSSSSLPYDPFLLREGFSSQDTLFEITFVLEEIRYRYGFSYNATSIKKEWLYRKITGRETRLFERQDDTIDVGSGFDGSQRIINLAIEATRTNGLFLSVCDMVNINLAKHLVKRISLIKVIGTFTEPLKFTTASLLENPLFTDKITNYIHSLDLNILGLRLETKEFDESDLPIDLNENMKNAFSRELKGAKKLNLLTQHTLYDIDGNATKDLITWNMEERESSGTNKALHISGPVLLSLSLGGVLLIDEVEANLHPLMTLETIKMFLNPNININKAQLIFSTHDTNLLNNAKLRRDQIYFISKGTWENSELFSLSDFKYLGERKGKVFSEAERPDSDKTKRYLEGRYGAVPNMKPLVEYLLSMRWLKEER